MPLASAVALATFMLLVAVTPVFAYNEWVSASGTVGGTAASPAYCTNDNASRWIKVSAPFVYSTTSSPQIVKTQQILQKWTLASGKYVWKNVADARGYVAPVRTHDYPRGYVDATVDQFVIGSSGYYRVVTKIVWPTGTGVALYEHRVISLAGAELASGQDWCRY